MNRVTQQNHSRLTIHVSRFRVLVTTKEHQKSEHTHKKERADIGSFFLKKTQKTTMGYGLKKSLGAILSVCWFKGKQQLVYIDLRENCRFNKIRLLIQGI